MILNNKTQNIQVHITGKCENCPYRVLEVLENPRYIDNDNYVYVDCVNVHLCNGIERYLMGVISVE